MAIQQHDIIVGGGPWNDQSQLQVQTEGPLTNRITLPNPPEGHQPTGLPYPVAALAPGTPNSTPYKRVVPDLDKKPDADKARPIYGVALDLLPEDLPATQ